MEIIQVTNPKFHKQTMRAICVSNAHHDIKLTSRMRTFSYHRKNFLARYERDCKVLSDRLADMATSMEASRAREEQERREKERRKADINETRELNVDRSAADENAILVMKKLIQAAMEAPEPIQEDRSQTASPASVKSRASTAKRSSNKMPSLQEIPLDKLQSLRPPTSTASHGPSPVSSSTSMEASESTETTGKKEVSSEGKRRRKSQQSTSASPDLTADNASTDSSERLFATAQPSSQKLTRQLRAVVTLVYGRENDLHPANITAVVNRLQPLVRRAVDESGQPLTSLGDDADIDLGAGGKAFQTLKNILSEEFADAATAEIEIEEKTAQRLKNRNKKLWEKFGTFLPVNTQPLYLQKRAKFTSRYWDFDSPIEYTQTVTDKDWDELRYCRYLRPGLPKFCKDKQDVFSI